MARKPDYSVVHEVAAFKAPLNNRQMNPLLLFGVHFVLVLLPGVSFPSLKMPRRRGNPNWGKSVPSSGLAVLTRFEREMRRLGLNKETCTGSSELRRWCERNRDQCYVPEWLLEAWGILVNAKFSGLA